MMEEYFEKCVCRWQTTAMMLLYWLLITNPMKSKMVYILSLLINSLKILLIVFLILGNSSIKKALEINADIYHLHDPELIQLGTKLKQKGKKKLSLTAMKIMF